MRAASSAGLRVVRLAHCCARCVCRVCQHASHKHLPDTKHSAIEAAFGKFTSSPNVGILLISQPVAESIRYVVSKHTKLIPTILEIPTKEEPYDPEKDSIMQKINRLTGQNK